MVDLDRGAIAVDFAFHLPHIDIRPASSVWDEWTWHEIRDLILRLRIVDGTTVREADLDVRSRTPRSEDRTRGH